jgi:hypothetical protein
MLLDTAGAIYGDGVSDASSGRLGVREARLYALQYANVAGSRRAVGGIFTASSCTIEANIPRRYLAMHTSHIPASEQVPRPW